MEVFNGVRFVRLRSCVRRGKYLAADVDGVGVCLSAQRGVYNSVWAVQHLAAGPDGPCVLLRGAYGRYLLATVVRAAGATAGPSSAVTAAQGDLAHHPPHPGMLWQAVGRGAGAFVLRCGTGRYLRANGRYLRWRRAVTAAGDNGSTMMQWAIENVPVRLGRPNIIDPTRQLTHRNRPHLNERDVTRLIRYARCETNGDITEAAWRAMEIHTNNILQLRLTLSSGPLGPIPRVTSTSLCIRAGRYGQLSPLLIDLPIGNNRIDIVIVSHGTPVDNNLRYPDLDAP